MTRDSGSSDEVDTPKAVPADFDMSSDSSDAIVVVMTAASSEEAGQIAEILIGSRLAACVQILPGIESIYRWKGTVTRDTEVLLLAKTTRMRFDELERRVRAVHSYETPEIVALPISDASEPYLNWLRAEVQPVEGTERASSPS